VKVLLIRDEDVADEIGVVEEKEMLRPDLVMRDVAVVTSHGDHHRQRITRYFDKKLKRVPRCRAGGVAPSIPRVCRWAESRDANFHHSVPNVNI